MEFEVREANPEDVPSLDILRRQAVEDGFSGVYERENFADRVAGKDERLREWIDSDSVRVWLVEHRFSPVCFGAFDPEDGRVLGVYTAPDHQRRGWGRTLMERFERTAKQDVEESPGTDVIEVKSPLNAVGFFRRLKYEEGEILEEGGLKLRRMRKILRC